LPKYQKKKGRVSHLFFETNLEKIISTPKNQLFPAKQEKKKEKKTATTTNLVSKAILPVLTASP